MQRRGEEEELGEGLQEKLPEGGGNQIKNPEATEVLTPNLKGLPQHPMCILLPRISNKNPSNGRNTPLLKRLRLMRRSQQWVDARRLPIVAKTPNFSLPYARCERAVPGRPLWPVAMLASIFVFFWGGGFVAIRFKGRRHQVCIAHVTFAGGRGACGTAPAPGVLRCGTSVSVLAASDRSSGRPTVFDGPLTVWRFSNGGWQSIPIQSKTSAIWYTAGVVYKIIRKGGSGSGWVPQPGWVGQKPGTLHSYTPLS